MRKSLVTRFVSMLQALWRGEKDFVTVSRRLFHRTRRRRSGRLCASCDRGRDNRINHHAVCPCCALRSQADRWGPRHHRGVQFDQVFFFDSPGPMAKFVLDVLNLTEVMLGRSLGDAAKAGSWKGLSLAFLDPRVWHLDERLCQQFEGTAEQMISRVGTEFRVTG
ncbi:hypothetical protein F4778DRAFT_677989 [Xylariomycetidae sp. FL2044]|nr:hypothetical protein F4778DRAFT_677989 [Xylariomycetidae sp. FL2044]